MIYRRNRVLPDEIFRWNFRPEIARARPHVAVRKFEPRASKGVGKLVRVFHEASRDSFVRRVEPQREIGRQHRRPMLFRSIVRVRHGRHGDSFRPPTDARRRALRKFPFVAKQVFEKVVAPFGRRRSPGDFQAAGDRVGTFARAEAVLPTEALRFDTCRFRLRTTFDAGAAPCVLPKV